MKDDNPAVDKLQLYQFNYNEFSDCANNSRKSQNFGRFLERSVTWFQIVTSASNMISDKKEVMQIANDPLASTW